MFGVPLPAGAVPSKGPRQLGAPAAGVEAPASLPGRGADPMGVAACLADRGLYLLHEGLQAPIGARPSAAGTADADVEVIDVIAYHLKQIGRPFPCCKRH